MNAAGGRMPGWAQSRLIVAAALAAVALAVAMVAMLALEATHQRDRALDLARSSTRYHAQLAGEHLTRHLSLIELTMVEIGAVAEPAILAGRFSARDAQRVLSRRGVVPGLLAMRLYGADGLLVADSRDEAPEPMDAHDADFFRAHRDQWVRFLAAPVPGDRQFALRLSRSLLNGPRFVGVIEAVVMPAAIGHAATGTSAEVDSVRLIDTSGTMLAVWPAGGAAPVAGAAVETVYQLPDYPLRVIAARSIDGSLADWRRATVKMALIGALILAGAAAFVVVVFRYSR